MMSGHLLCTVLALFTFAVMWQSCASNDASPSISFSSFVSTVDLPYAMSDMTAVTVPETFFNTNDGPRIYIIGGCISNQQCTVDSDPAKGIFCICTEVTNQMIYFTPQTNEYHTNVAPMPFPRYRHVSARLGNYIYVAGGRDVNDSVLNDIYRYDIMSNSWEFVITWENATSDGVAFSTPTSTNLFLVSGYSQYYNIIADMTVFDTSAGTFLPFGSFPPMSIPRGDAQIASLYDTQFYVIGGWSTVNDDSFCFPSKAVEYFDTTQNEWFTIASMTYGRGDLAAGVLDNMIFAVGGEQRDPSDSTCTYSVPVKNVERYASAVNNHSWLIEESIPDNIFRFVGATYNTSNSVYSSAIYLFGGQGTYDENANVFPIRNSTLVYYPQAIYGSRRQKPKLDAAGIAGIVIAGVVVLACIVLGIFSALVYRYTYYRYKSLEDAEEVNVIPGSAAGNRGSSSGITMVSTGRSGPSDQDLENMEMQESFPDRMHKVDARSLAVSTSFQSGDRF